MTTPGTEGRPRRADARRNTEGIRRAALDVFPIRPVGVGEAIRRSLEAGAIQA